MTEVQWQADDRAGTVCMTTDIAAEKDTRRWAGRSRFCRIDGVGILVFLGLCALVTVLTTVGIIAVLGVETLRFFEVSGIGPFAFLIGTELNPDLEPPSYGILPLIWGTGVIAAGSSLIALPIGLLSAIYLSEYAPRRLRAVLKPSLEML